jgi:hypothetical protein
MSRDPIQVLTMIGAMLTPIAIGVSAWLLLRSGDTAHAKQIAAIDALRHQFEQSRSSVWVDAGSTAHNCYADNASISCTVTNIREEAITTCLMGKLSQRKASGVSLSSLVMCTGQLGPRETRNVSSPWTGGFARDICNSLDHWGNSILDWQACNFNIEAVGIPALEAVAPKAAK